MAHDFRASALQDLSDRERAEALALAVDCRVAPDDPTWLFISAHIRARPDKIASAVTASLRPQWREVGDQIHRDVISRLNNTMLWGTPRYRLALICVATILLVLSHAAIVQLAQLARVSTMQSDIDALEARRRELQSMVIPKWVWPARGKDDSDVIFIESGAETYECTLGSRPGLCIRMP